MTKVLTALTAPAMSPPPVETSPVAQFLPVFIRFSAMLLQIVYHVLVGVMLVSCYMRICDAEDEDMPLRRSRFAWVNRIREERARREQAAADSVTKYAEDKLKKRREERERRYNAQNRKKRK